MAGKNLPFFVSFHMLERKPTELELAALFQRGQALSGEHVSNIKVGSKSLADNSGNSPTVKFKGKNVVATEAQS